MEKGQNVKLVLRYLKEKGCIESFLTLERETGISYISYSKQIQFFKKIMLRGDFNEAINFILTFENRMEEKDIKKIIMNIYHQKLYELIENPNQEELKNIFEKQLIHYCHEDQFQLLFGYLMYRSVNEIEGLEKWSVMKGRYSCFQAVIPFLEMFNSVLKEQDNQESLENIIQYYYTHFNQPKEQLPHSNIFKDSFQKNKSVASESRQQEEKALRQERAAKQERAARQERNERQKQTIRNSVMNMNLSGNYSQMKNRMGNAVLSNPSKVINNSSQPIQNKSQKSIPGEKIQGDKNTLYDKYQKSGVYGNISSVSDRRPRVNASLNGPMTQNKLEGSVRVDNFVKPEEDNMQQSKNIRQPNQSAPINSYSQMAKSKRQNASSYSNHSDLPLKYPNDLSSSELNEISEEEQSENTKSVKNEKYKESRGSYLFKEKEEEQINEDIRRNIEYLQQTSSVIQKSQQIEKQNFTFSSQFEDKVKNIVKLAVISDSKAIRTCQFSESGTFFAVGTNSSILKVFDVQRLFQKNKFQEITPIYQIDGLHAKSIFCLDWSKNERSLITCSNDLNIKLTEINKGFSEHKTTIIGKHQSCIRMVKYNGQQSRIVSCGDDSTIRVWDLGKVKKTMSLKGHTSSVGAIKLQNENEVYSVSKDMTIRKWDLRVGESVATSKPQESQLTYIASNTDKIIVSHRDGNVSFFNTALQLQHSIQIHEEQIRSIEALRNQNMLLTASFDGHVALFTERSAYNPEWHQHNENDKVVFATFLHSGRFRGFSSTSTLGLCHIYSYQ